MNILRLVISTLIPELVKYLFDKWKAAHEKVRRYRNRNKAPGEAPDIKRNRPA